jgi:MarR family transcriptional regulator, lower aerobic nicotinate degradation pathway regulator
MTPPRRLTKLPSWLAGQAAQRASRLVSDALGEEGFRRHHFAVMTALAEDGAASQAELGRRVWLDRSDLHAVLNELERDGLVARKQDERDRRRNLVELTPAGVETLERLDARVDAAQEEFLAPLTAAERRDLVRLLERLRG